MYHRWLATTALSYAVLHHLGLLPDGLGSAPGGTQWADWLDLSLPWLVLSPAAMALAVAGATPRQWVVFAVGAVAYTSGHGIHLAANSIANAEPGSTAHLWDEAVGHILWYAGVATVVGALAATMRGRRRPRGRPLLVGASLSIAAGITWGTNALGGVGTAVPGLVAAVAGCAWGWQHRRSLGGLVLLASLAAVAVLCGQLLL